MAETFQLPKDEVIYFECTCGSMNHTKRFAIYVWHDDDVNAVISTYLGRLPLWKRIVEAVRYVFGRRCNGAFDDFILREEDVPRMRAWLNDFEIRRVTVEGMKP